MVSDRFQVESSEQLLTDSKPSRKERKDVTGGLKAVRQDDGVDVENLSQH